MNFFGTNTLVIMIAPVCYKDMNIRAFRDSDENICEICTKNEAAACAVASNKANACRVNRWSSWRFRRSGSFS